MDIIPGKPIYVYIRNVKDKTVILLKFMIFDSESNASTCVMHARDDKPYMWKRRAQYRCNETNLIPVLRLLVLSLFCLSGLTSK